MAILVILLFLNIEPNNLEICRYSFIKAYSQKSPHSPSINEALYTKHSPRGCNITQHLAKTCSAEQTGQALLYQVDYLVLVTYCNLLSLSVSYIYEKEILDFNNANVIKYAEIEDVLLTTCFTFLFLII